MPDVTPPPGDIWAAMTARHALIADERPPADGPPEHRPEVAILSCSDARVPPSHLFGQSPGTMFVVRNAGNSATPDAVASLTFAVEYLDVGLIVVLGHTACGAVTAAVEGIVAPGLAPNIAPIDDVLVACGSECDDVDTAVTANVRHNMRRLERDRGPLGAAIAEGRATVRGAVHDLTSGRLVEVDAENTSDSTSATTSDSTSDNMHSTASATASTSNRPPRPTRSTHLTQPPHPINQEQPT